jgi:hypothetical protein
MTKKELIQTIKNEIKAISSTFREHKKALRKHQSNTAKGLPSGFVWDSFKYESQFTRYLSGFESIKCHLTCLHIAYNMLRNKKQHCHNEERNNYYVQNFKSFMERASSYEEEKQDAHLS